MTNMYIKKCSTSLILREKQIKAHILKRWTIPDVLEGVECLELSNIASRSIKWYNHFGKYLAVS